MFNLLADNWRTLDLDRFGAPSRFSWLLVGSPTLSHGSARHVVVLLIDRRSAAPVLVAKLARVPGDDLHLRREIAALRAAHAAWGAGFESIPRLVAAAEVRGRTLLIETALDGVQVTPALLRRRFERCAGALTTWLVDFHRATADRRGPDVAALVQRPLERLAPMLVRSRDDEWLVRQTVEIVGRLRGAPIAAAFEHGDLYYPNILLRDGAVAILDWETSERRGFPGGDLFFFLGCAAFGRAGTPDTHQGVEPFDEAFFPPAAWTRPFVRRYVDALQLDREWLTPLFVACWTRFVLMKAARMVGVDVDDVDALRPSGTVDHLAGKLHALRDYRLWRHAVHNVDRLRWNF